MWLGLLCLFISGWLFSKGKNLLSFIFVVGMVIYTCAAGWFNQYYQMTVLYRINDMQTYNHNCRLYWTGYEQGYQKALKKNEQSLHNQN
jgi:hypothetical protein